MCINIIDMRDNYYYCDIIRYERRRNGNVVMACIIILCMAYSNDDEVNQCAYVCGVCVLLLILCVCAYYYYIIIILITRDDNVCVC